MKRVLYIVFTVLELAFLVGAHVLDYFAHAKLGMNRWLVYHNQKWEEALPLPAFEGAVAVVLVALLVWAIVKLVRNSRRRPIAVVSTVVAAACVAVYLLSACVLSAESMHAYYLVLILLALLAVAQCGKALVFAGAKRNEPAS